MDITISGVNTTVTDRFRAVAEEKCTRIETLAPRTTGVDIRVKHHSYRNGNVEEYTVELTLSGLTHIVRSEAKDADKFIALDAGVDKLCEQLRRAKEKRIDERHDPRGAKFEKRTGTLSGIDVQPASADVLRAVAEGETLPSSDQSEEDNPSPIVIRSKDFSAEWMTVEEAVDRMELVGHDFFLFINARTDRPSVVYRRKGWSYGVIALEVDAQAAS